MPDTSTPSSPKPETPLGLLDGYLTRTQLARAWDVHERTVARYEGVPDGLPFMQFGGRRLYPIDGARAFMERHLVRPNPTRKAG